MISFTNVCHTKQINTSNSLAWLNKANVGDNFHTCFSWSLTRQRNLKPLKPIDFIGIQGILREGPTRERCLLTFTVRGSSVVMEKDAGSHDTKIMSSCDILAQV